MSYELRIKNCEFLNEQPGNNQGIGAGYDQADRTRHFCGEITDDRRWLMMKGDIAMATQYAKPEMLVSTEWVAQHRADPGLRIVEVDVDTAAYETGHIPGAV